MPRRNRNARKTRRGEFDHVAIAQREQQVKRAAVHLPPRREAWSLQRR